MHRLTLGDFELTVISDGTYYLDGGAFFGVVPKTMWEKKAQADEKNRVHVGLNSLVIRTGEKTVLVETGIGNKLPERVARHFSPQCKLLDNMAAAGVSPDEVDVVINTHLHFDHCGWNTIRNTSGNVVPTFPRATYYTQKGEWEHGCLQLERDAVSYMTDNYDPLIRSGQMQLLSTPAWTTHQIVPGVCIRVLPGHTRHMQAVMIESQGKKACYISDLIPTTAHLEPTWVMAFDLFPLETIENKKKVYEESLPERWLTVFTHDPQIPWAYVERTAEGKLVARSAE